MILGVALFPRAADRDLRILAAHAARRLQFRRLSRRLRQRQFPGDRSSIRRRWRSSPSSSASLIVVPTAYWVQLRLPRLRGLVEFITLLPLVIPAIVLVFGYIKLYGSSSILPLTATSLGADALLMFGYVGLGLPYMYRSVETALRAIDVRTLTEAAESQGAGLVTILFQRHPAQHPLRHPVGRVPDLRHRHRRVHLREPARPPRLRPLSAADRRHPRLRAVGAGDHRLRAHLGLHGAHSAVRRRRSPVPPTSVRIVAMSFLALTGIHKTFGANAVVKDFDLAVERGEFVTFLGPSGCGKTTTLRMIAGFETPTAGDPHRRPGRHASARQPARDRHGVPVLRAVPQHDGRRTTSASASRSRASRRPRSRRASTRCWR